MRDPDWPSDEAWRLLQEIEADPHGYGYLDVERLLDAWGVVEGLPGEDLLWYRVRVHPSHPTFIFGYPVRDPLAAPTIQYICNALREFHRLQTEGNL